MNAQEQYYPDFGGRLTDILKRLHWTQRQLAGAIDVKEWDISKAKSGIAGEKVQGRIARKMLKYAEVKSRLLPDDIEFFDRYAQWCEDQENGMTTDSWADRWRSVQGKYEPAQSQAEVLNFYVPLQRPPRVPYFTGREKEIEQVVNELEPGRVITLCGLGGIGKSAIAAEVIWRLAPADEPPKHFPNGVIFHDFYKEPQSAIFLEQIARSFGEEPYPTAAAATQRILSGRKVLLVLDGVENADELGMVLAVRGTCGVLITSRSRKDIIGIRHDIVPLPIEEAVKVLQAWGGVRVANNKIAEQIANLVGGLPLAVRLAGSYMAEREEEAADYLTWLQETPLAALDHGQRQHESIPLLLQRSLDQVSEAAQQTMSVTGLLALAPFSREVIAAALAVPIGEAGRMLGDLVRYSLLARPQDYYQVTHALVHTYAKQRLTIPAKAVMQLAAYYINLAQEQSQLGQEGYKRLDTERAHIMAVLAECIEKKHWERVQGLVKAVDTYLDIHGHWFERVIVNKAGVKAAQAREDRQAKGFWLGQLGVAYYSLGQYQTAIEHYQQALTIAREIGDSRNEGTWLGNLGTTYTALGQPQAAIDHYQQALTIAKKISNRLDEGAWLGNLGFVYADLGQYQTAIEHYQQALTIAREIGDRRGEGTDLGHLGLAYDALGQYQIAIEHYQQALTIVREIGDRRGEGTWLGTLGIMYRHLGQPQAAIEHYQQALAIIREIGDRYNEGIYLGNLGIAYYFLGQYQTAIEHYQQALTITREIGDYRNEGTWLGNLGYSYAKLGDSSKAIAHCQRALSIKRETGDRSGEGEVLNYLGYAYYVAGDLSHALEFHQQSITILHETGYKQSLIPALIDLGEVFWALNDHDQAEQNWQQALRIAQEIGDKLSEASAFQHLGLVTKK